MSKTLLVAEKPSVGQDLARVLQGPFKKQEGFLEGPEHVVTWAVGHLVQLAEPEAYDPKYKSWRMADLPIVPERFKLVVRDERSRKQMSVVTKQLGRDDVDGGRQRLRRRSRGRADLRLPVREGQRQEAGETAVAELDDERGDEERARGAAPGGGVRAPRAGGAVALGGRLDRGHERHARGDDPPAQLLRRRRLARARADADARDRRPPRGGDQGVQAGALLAGGRDVRGGGRSTARRRGERVYIGHFQAPAGSPGQRRKGPRIATEEEALAIVSACEGRPGTITKLEKKEQREKAPMLYDLTTLQREANNRYGFSAKRTLAAAQRLYEEHKALTYPRTNSRYLTTDMVEEIKPIAELVGAHPEYRKGAEYVAGLDVLPLGARGQRREGHRPPRDHPHALRAQPREDGLRRQAHLRHGGRGASWRCSTPRRCSRTRAWRRPSPPLRRRRSGRAARAPPATCSAPAASSCSCPAGAASTTRWPPTRRPPKAKARGEEDEETDQQLPRLRAGRAGADARDRERAQGNQTAAALQRRVAAGRDGDGGQARRRRRAARGDEGLGDRHAGHARGDHRAADHGRLRGARRARAGGDARRA